MYTLLIRKAVKETLIEYIKKLNQGGASEKK
jgi:hypothetical protein